jgi:hypothetical protein
MDICHIALSVLFTKISTSSFQDETPGPEARIPPKDFHVVQVPPEKPVYQRAFWGPLAKQKISWVVGMEVQSGLLVIAPPKDSHG